jgi:hypothetical protein
MILLVWIEIWPFAKALLAMVRPFLVPEKLNLLALKTLSALIFSLKTAFEPFAIQTFSHALTLLQVDQLEFDFVLYLLQILTHLVIFCKGSQRPFFREISKRAIQDSLISSYAINFLSQAIWNQSDDTLLLPALRLAESLIHRPSSLQEACGNLLAVLATKMPGFVSPIYRQPPIIVEVVSDPYRRSRPRPIHTLQLSLIEFPIQVEGPFDNWLLTLGQRLVLCSSCPA